ncbi:MAG: saccharopine dehydrogenase NADP-binding domain-containing protein [Actinobacteria bacterium]|nr:saccharopine dehydrogenase NADP-binding domain-containing protein [Actinomycetota bacterium]
MSDLVVIGVGEMGRASLAILARRLPEQPIRVLDAREDNLRRAIALAPDRITGEVTDVYASPPDLSGARLVLNFAGPFYTGTDAIPRAAVAAGADYVDICDDVEGIGPVLALDPTAREAGVTLITGAGNSPGTSNLMAKRLLELHPGCDGVRVVWVVGDDDPGGLAPLRHMLHMAVAPCPVWRDGEFVDEPGFVPETAEVYDLPEIGETVAYNTAHSEPLTLVRAFPELRYAAVQGALLPAWSNELFSSIGRLGFGVDDLRVEIEGREIDPVEVLWKLLWKRHERRKPGVGPDGLTIVQTQVLEGDDVVAKMTVVDPYPMSRTTALGAAATALAVLADDPPAGASGPEILEAESTLALVEELAAEEGAIPGGLRIEPAATQRA